MKRRNIEHKYRKIDAPFSDTEYKAFRSFIQNRGYKTGAWVKSVILSAMAQEEAIRENRTQIEMSVFKPEITTAPGTGGSK